MAALKALHFFDDQITVEFDSPLIYEKTPVCPNRFTWCDQKYEIVDILLEWRDFERRGRSARNMRPAHAEAASTKGSLGVGRFYFRIKTDNNQYFDLYYDRAPKDAIHRKGSWFLFRELGEESNSSL